MDASEFTGRLGQALIITVAGGRQPVVAMDTTATHVMLGDWAEPPGGDGSISNARWIALDTITAVAPWTFSQEAVDAAPRPPGPEDDDDPQVDPTALTYPDAPEGAEAEAAPA